MKSVNYKAGGVQLPLRSSTLLNMSPYSLEDPNGKKPRPCVEVKFPQLERKSLSVAVPKQPQLGCRASVDINRSYIQHYRTVQRQRELLKPRHNPTRQSWPAGSMNVVSSLNMLYMYFYMINLNVFELNYKILSRKSQCL